MMQICPIEPPAIRFVWPLVKRHIQRSQERGPSDMTLDEIKFLCSTDESWRLLMFEDAAAAAVIRILNDRIHVVAIGGRFHKGWHVEFFDWLKRIAAFFGLKGVTLGGRKGWGRLLAPLGFVSLGGDWYGVDL